MRPFIEKQLHGRMLPLTMAHKGGTAYGTENAAETIRRALTHKPDIIEVDVHKSRDKILYCYHGSIPFGVIEASFAGIFTFARIQKLVGHRNTLAEIIDVIPDDVLLYLDIKDSAVSARDLKPLIEGRKNIWLAPFGTIGQLKRLRRGLGPDYGYALNRWVLFPRHAARRLRGHADLMQFFFWSWNWKTVSRIEEDGIMCHLSEWFIREEKWIALARLSRWRCLFFSVYNLAEAREIEDRIPFE